VLSPLAYAKITNTKVSALLTTKNNWICINIILILTRTQEYFQENTQKCGFSCSRCYVYFMILLHYAYSAYIHIYILSFKEASAIAINNIKLLSIYYVNKLLI
jgi:hypothetical protein